MKRFILKNKISFLFTKNIVDKSIIPANVKRREKAM